MWWVVELLLRTLNHPIINHLPRPTVQLDTTNETEGAEDTRGEMPSPGPNGLQINDISTFLMREVGNGTSFKGMSGRQP